jgi:hypothetical protein
MATPTTLPATFVAGDVLTAAQMNGVRGAFRILQVVSSQLDSTFTTTSSSFVSVGLTATITPSSTSSRVLIIMSGNQGNNSANITYSTVYRGTTAGTQLGAAGGFATEQATNLHRSSCSAVYLDSPATASAQIYTVAMKTTGGTAGWNEDTGRTTLTLLEVSN